MLVSFKVQAFFSLIMKVGAIIMEEKIRIEVYNYGTMIEKKEFDYKTEFYLASKFYFKNYSNSSIGMKVFINDQYIPMVKASSLFRFNDPASFKAYLEENSKLSRYDKKINPLTM